MDQKLPIGRNGGPGWSVGARPEIIDFIPLSKPPLLSTIPEMVTLYSSGYSLYQISKKLGKAKTTIKCALKSQGIVLRPATGSLAFRKLDKNARRSAHAPFGFVVLRNEFVVHPTEHEVLLEIKKLAKLGRGPRQIANRLNELALPTRSKKPWAHSVVTGILNRLKVNQYPYNGVKV